MLAKHLVQAGASIIDKLICINLLYNSKPIAFPKITKLPITLALLLQFSYFI